ncbi:MAG: hypothetical protein IJ094_01090 [Bacilli bacterium]|nr:hypothetical protein [Bacilli bacterium]
MEEEQKSINIPIKTIVENAMTANGAKYEEDEFNLLRRYFIACLNLGFLTPNDLTLMVNKFASKIKFIVLNYNNINKMDCYTINGNILYINGAFKYDNSKFYETNFFKAVTEVIFNANDKHIGVSNALTNMAAEKIYNMDVNESRIVMPKTVNEMIGNDKIEIRAGYDNYNLTISLFKQLVISKHLNENRIIHDMYFSGYENVLNSTFNTEEDNLLLSVLDKLCLMYIKRIVMKSPDTSEKVLLDKYQIMVNQNFTKMDQNYLAFCALITTADIRERCMKKFENK